MRIVKEAEERKNEILDVVEELFAVKGFDSTSTNDILEKVKIAKGTLYYHFKSKEDILDGVIDRMISRMMEKAAGIAAAKNTPILGRLTGAIMALNVDNGLGREVMEQMHRPQNALMHQKIQEKLLAGIVPILTDLLEEGKEQGIFHTEYGMEGIEMAMLYANTMFDDLVEQSPEQRERRMQGFIYNVERLLGTESGALQKAIMQIFTSTV